MNEPLFHEKRIDPRQYVQCPAKVYVGYDAVNAQSMNFSESGIRLQFSEPVRISMRVKIGDYEDDRQADLVWARKDAEGKMEIGLQYPGESEAIQRDEKNKETYPSPDGLRPGVSLKSPESLFPANPFWSLRW
ncbi:MAG: PilZ domain-containing protein [Candidatus Ozemobacteraceae bacterium]